MKMSSVLLLCLVAACSVRAVHGRTLEVSIDDEEDVDMDVDMDVSVDARGVNLPGKCWACKWILSKVKKFAGPNATAESLSLKLLSICNEIGLLKPLCNKFVKVHLAELIEEVTTTDDVRTICVNMGACKPKEVDLFINPRKGDPRIEIKQFH